MGTTVTRREILANLHSVWCEFGPSVTARCLRVLVTRRPTTLLDFALRDAVLSPSGAQALRRGPERQASRQGPRGRS